MRSTRWPQAQHARQPHVASAAASPLTRTPNSSSHDIRAHEAVPAPRRACGLLIPPAGRSRVPAWVSIRGQRSRRCARVLPWRRRRPLRPCPCNTPPPLHQPRGRMATCTQLLRQAPAWPSAFRKVAGACRLNIQRYSARATDQRDQLVHTCRACIENKVNMMHIFGSRSCVCLRGHCSSQSVTDHESPTIFGVTLSP